MSAPTAERPASVGDIGSTPKKGARAARMPRPARASRAPRAPRLPRDQPQGTPALISTTFTMLAIVCLWTAAQMLVFSGVSHDRAQALLYRDFRVQLADTTAPLGPIVPAGDPMAIIGIPAIGVDEVVVEGTASGDTLVGPGHRRDSPLPGQEGVSLVYGRAATYGAPFRRITELQPGDAINLTTSQGEKTLRVVGVRHEGDPLLSAPPAGVTRITLTTAEGSGPLAGLTANSAVFVDAEASGAFPTPSGRPTAVPDSEKVMAKDSGALPLLALCLALLLALTLGVVAARQRWSAPLVWVLASPLALALAWMTTDTVMRLLPTVI